MVGRRSSIGTERASMVHDEPESPGIQIVKNMFLTHWVLKYDGNMDEVYVEGLNKHNHQRWHSTSICNRLANDRVQTASGRIYVLEGTMNMQSAHEYGLPRILRTSFEFGFPENWRQIINECRETKGARQLNRTKWYDYRLKGLDTTLAAPPKHPAISRIMSQTMGVRQKPNPPRPLANATMQNLEPPRRSPRNNHSVAKTNRSILQGCDESHAVEVFDFTKNADTQGSEEKTLIDLGENDQATDLRHTPVKKRTPKHNKSRISDDSVQQSPSSHPEEDEENGGTQSDDNSEEPGSPVRSMRHSPRFAKLPTPKMDFTQQETPFPLARKRKVIPPELDDTQIETPPQVKRQKTPKMDKTQQETPKKEKQKTPVFEKTQVETPRQKKMVEQRKKEAERVPEGLEDDDVVELNYWFFRVNSRDEVIVLGYKTAATEFDDDDQFNIWRSSSIKERLSSKYVRTFSGRVYKLGQMDDLAAAQEGYTRHILDAFKDGFPLKWEKYIKSWLATRRTMPSVNASGWFGQGEQSRNSGSKQSNRHHTQTVSDSDDGDDELETEEARINKYKEANKEKSESPCNSLLRKNSLFTAVGDDSEPFHGTSPEPVELDDDFDEDDDAFKVPPVKVSKKKVEKEKPKQKRSPVKKKQKETEVSKLISDKNARLKEMGLEGTFVTSKRSGRLVKPRMASWAGQRIVYDNRGNPISVADPVTINSDRESTQSPSMSLVSLAPYLEVAASPGGKQVEGRRKKKTIVRHSSDEDSDHDDEDFKPTKPTAPKKTKPKRRKPGVVSRDLKSKSKKKVKKEKSPSAEPEPQTPSPEKPKMKTRWNQKDLQLLQHTLKVVKPETLTDWERVSKYLGGMFTIESIKAKANATFGYDLQVEERREKERKLRHVKMMKEKQANAGTLAARQEVSRFMAEAHKTRDDNDDDYFASRINDEDTVLMPSIANVSRNDPILSAMETPDVGPSKDRRYIPLPQSSASSNNSSEDIRPCATPDTTERRQRDRMVHKLHRDKAFQMAQGRGGRAMATKKQTKITVAKKGGRVIEQRVDMSYVHAKGATYKSFFNSQMQQDQDEDNDEDDYFDEHEEM